MPTIQRVEAPSVKVERVALEAAVRRSFRVGYESPSQFGREYLRMFGVPPRRSVVAIKVEAQMAGSSGV